MVEIRSAGPERLPALASVLASAFADDPLVRWMLGGSSDGDRLAAFFREANESAVLTGLVWEAVDAAGVAVWVPPGESLAESDADVIPRLAPLTTDGGERLRATWRWLGAQLPNEPVHYLDQLAVDPRRQRGGIGSALVQLGLDRARADGVPAFLETAVELNVGFYERFGFRVVAEETLADGPPVWFMRRDAPGKGRTHG